MVRFAKKNCRLGYQEMFLQNLLPHFPAILLAVSGKRYNFADGFLKLMR